jgi:hypothetical protein
VELTREQAVRVKNHVAEVQENHQILIHSMTSHLYLVPGPHKINNPTMCMVDSYRTNGIFDAVREIIRKHEQQVHIVSYQCTVCRDLIKIPWRATDPVLSAVVCTDCDAKVTAEAVTQEA